MLANGASCTDRYKVLNWQIPGWFQWHALATTRMVTVSSAISAEIMGRTTVSDSSRNCLGRRRGGLKQSVVSLERPRATSASRRRTQTHDMHSCACKRKCSPQHRAGRKQHMRVSTAELGGNVYPHSGAEGLSVTAEHQMLSCGHIHADIIKYPDI